MVDWGHNELLEDLASHIAKTGVNGSRMTWVDIPMGPGGSQRPDLFSLEKSFAKPNPTVYEVKVSKSDFRSDVTSGKWVGYTKFASRIIFCVPQGLVKKDEVPGKAGLMVRGPNGWRSIKKATVSGQMPEFGHMLKLLMHTDGLYRDRERVVDINYFKIADKVGKKHGEKIAKIISDVARAEYEIKDAEKEAERIIARAGVIEQTARQKAIDERDRHMRNYNNAIAGVKEALGLPDDTDHFSVISEIKKIAIAIQGTNIEKQHLLYGLLRKATGMADELRWAIDHLKKIETNALNNR